MQVILLEKIGRLGKIGEQVIVKSGFARNYLIPSKKAVFATQANLQMVEAKKAELEKIAEVAFQEATQRAEKLQALEVTMKVQSSDEGKLYGSIGVRELADAITAAGVEVAKQEIRLPEGPLHYLGTYEVAVQLHSDVTAVVKIVVLSDKLVNVSEAASPEVI